MDFSPRVARGEVDLHAIEAMPSHRSRRRAGLDDFAVMVTQPLSMPGPWEEAGHPPEADFIAKLKAIPGVSQVETQTITNMVL